MDIHIPEGQWPPVRGKIKQRWAQITDDDLQQADGQWDALVDIIRAKYDMPRVKVEAALIDLVHEVKRESRTQ